MHSLSNVFHGSGSFMLKAVVFLTGSGKLVRFDVKNFTAKTRIVKPDRGIQRLVLNLNGMVYVHT